MMTRSEDGRVSCWIFLAFRVSVSVRYERLVPTAMVIRLRTGTGGAKTDVATT